MRVEVTPHVRPEQFAPPEIRRHASEDTERVEDARERELFGTLLRIEGLNPEISLELLANYKANEKNNDLKEKVKQFIESYGLDLDQFSQEDQSLLETLYLGVERCDNGGPKEELRKMLEKTLHVALVDSSFETIDAALENINMMKSDKEKLKDGLHDLLQSLWLLSKRVPPENQNNIDLWKGVNERFQSLVSLKKDASKDLQEVYMEVFDEFSDFIDDEFVAREAQRLRREEKPYSVEHVMQEVYGRSKEEIEMIKTKNRKKVAEYLKKMKDQPIHIDQISELHAINNKGIIPKSEARLRSKGSDVISFGVRFGIFPSDVKTEMEDVVGRANDVVGRKKEGAIDLKAYEIAVAKLHNDFLDIHPLPDRNGSSALIFIELLMSKQGYEPSEIRRTDYYAFLKELLNDNEVAVGVVAEEHRMIAYTPGYFEGKTTQAKERLYHRALEIMAERRQEQKKDRELKTAA